MEATGAATADTGSLEWLGLLGLPWRSEISSCLSAFFCPLRNQDRQDRGDRGGRERQGPEGLAPGLSPRPRPSHALAQVPCSPLRGEGQITE